MIVRRAWQAEGSIRLSRVPPSKSAWTTRQRLGTLEMNRIGIETPVNEHLYPYCIGNSAG